jgi:hypothetical protein
VRRKRQKWCCCQKVAGRQKRSRRGADPEVEQISQFCKRRFGISLSVISSKLKVELGVILLCISDNLWKSYNIIKSLSFDFTYLMLAAKSFINNNGDRNDLLISGRELIFGCFELKGSQCCRRMKKNVLKVINELPNISVCIFNHIFTCKNVNLYYINCIIFKLVIKCENMINKRQLNITISLFIELLLAWLCTINETKKHQEQTQTKGKRGKQMNMYMYTTNGTKKE